MLCVPWVTQAQELSEYSLSVDTTTFTSIVSTGTAISLSTTDDGHGECNLPFVFPFGESMLSANTTLSCSANGFINLGGSASGTYAYYTSASQRIINALINQDAHSGRHTGSGVYYQLDTVDGVQCFTIEFHLLGRYSEPYGVYSHQVKLYENGNIQFVYDSVDLDGATATTLRTFLWDGPMDDLAFVTGPWANPTLGTHAATRPTSPTPVHGLRYTFTRPVILCPRVTNLTVSSATTTTADLTWQDTSASRWMLYYYPSDSIGQIDSALVIDTPSYSLSSLYPNTEYTVQVVALCSDTTSSNPRSLVFRTLCLGLTATDLPYTEGFESYGSGSASPISPCWYKHSTSSTAYPYPTSSNAISGSRSLFFYAYLGSSGTRYHSYAVLPYLDSTVSVNTLALLLDVKSYSTASQYYPSRLVVGVMTDPTDITTFTTVQEIDMYGLPANTEQQVVVDFSNYSGNGRYICLYDSIPILRGSANYGYSYVYADNIVLTELPNCATPTQLDTANVTSHEADLTWSGSYDAQEYYVTYGPENGTDTTITVYDSIVQLTDLMSGTRYHWSVRSYCGVDTSLSAQGPFFTTLCGEVTLPQLPYSYGFEDAASTGAGGAINPCWEKVGLNQTTAYPYPSATAHTGTRSLYFYAYSSSNRKSWVCSPEMSVSMDSLLVTFWNRSSSSSYSGIIKVGTMSDPTDLGTFHLLASCRPNGTTWTYQVVPMATTDTGRYIAFLCEANGDPVNANYNYSYLDDITISLMPNCTTPTQLDTANVTRHEADLTWSGSYDAQEYYVTYGPENGTDTTITVYDSIVQLTDLMSGTRYHWSVRSYCGVDTSLSAQGPFFTTLCGEVTLPQLPYSYGFEDAASTGAGGAINPCWEKVGLNQTTAYPYPSATAHTGTRSLYFYAYSSSNRKSWVCSPEMSVSMDSLLVTFWNRSSSSSYSGIIKVGTMSDPTDLGTFHLLASCRPNGTTWTYQEVPMATTDTGRHIAFLCETDGDPVSTSTNYAYLDDITIDLMPNCYHVVNLEVGGTTPVGAVLNWEPTPSDAEANYMVEYRADSSNTWIVAASDVTESSYSLSGLDAGTRYHARVSALCSMGDTSTFQSVQFTTGQFGCMEVDTTTLVVDTIGTGSSTTTGVPVNSSWGNTICQSIYLASELIAGGFDSTGATITDISYTWQNNASYAKEFTIYMNNSSQSTYSSYDASNWVVTGAAAQVYHGDHPIGTNGTVTYHLDTPFQWDGVSNLVITTTMNQPTGVSQSVSSFYGYSTSCGATRTVYRYRDSNPFDGSNVTNLTNSGNTSQYRPNIILTSSACTRYATCAAPAVAADYVGPDTVVLSWAAGANETDWNIYYRVGESGDFTYVDNVSDMTYTFDGLQPATTYTFRVQTVCDPDTFNADFEVMTACAPVNVINEDFESYTTGSGGSINPCWHKHVQGTSTQYPYVNTIGSSKALYFYGYNSNNSTHYLCWATTPEMLDSLSTYELEFDMRRTSTGAQYWSRLIIGAMTDPENIATFDTIAVVDAAVAGVWETKYVSLENYHDTGAHYIAFLSPSPDLAPGYSSVYNYAYMDNLYVGRRSSCPRPTRFHARDITDVSAELAWDGSDEHLSATVKWGTVNNINAATDSLEVFSNSVVLNALTPTTTYYAWITAQCADEGSRTYSCSFTTSAACNPIDNITISEVTTNMAAITWDDNDLTPAVGYTFRWKADSATTWNVVNLTQPFYFLTGLTEGTSYSVSVSAICNTDSATAVTQSFATLTTGTLGGSSEQLVLPTYPYYNYSISEQLWTASELNIYGDTVNGIYFNSSAINPDRVMKIWIADTTLSDLSTSNYVSSADMTLVYDSTHSITTGWNYFQFTTPYVRNSNNNLVVLVMDSTGDYEDFDGWYGGVGACTSLFAYNDDDPYSSTNLSGLNTSTSRAQMMLDARSVVPTCMAPHVVAADVTGSSVTLAWMAGQDETSWTVDYRQRGDTGWTSYTVSTTDTFAVVGGLNPSTQYQFRVGALCAADTQYAHLLANTACGTYDVPYFEDFNNYANNTYRFNACWYYGNASTTNEPYTINITGQGMMMLMPIDSYVILPAVNGSISSLQLRCDYVVADTNIYALVGICSHPHDIYSMTVIDTLWASANGVPEQVIVPFDSYTDTAGYICIYSSYNQSYYDNIRIEPIPACPTVDSLMATNISTTSADLAWVGSANATSYLVQYGLVGSDSTTTVSTTNNYITLLGLHHSTSYQVTVSTVCASMNDTSLATNPYVFITNCQPVDSLPYFEDFDHSNAPALTNTGILPNCWTYQTLASGSYATGDYLPQIYNSSTYASSGNYS